jgi:hypothetical protein
MDIVPHEISLSWLYIPPVLLVVAVGSLLAFLLTRVLNRTGLSRFFWYPPLVAIAFAAIFSALTGLFLLSP